MAPKKQKPEPVTTLTWGQRIAALKAKYAPPGGKMTDAALGLRLGVSGQNISDFRTGHRVPPKCVQKLIALMESGNPLENLD